MIPLTFRHSIPNSNMLTTFNPFPDKFCRSTYPHMIFQWSEGSVYPVRHGGTFFKKESANGR